MLQLSRIRRYRERGFSTREIASLLDVTTEVVAWVERGGPRENRTKAYYLGRRLMKHMPWWWEGTENSWRHCVWANFCDVLPAAMNPNPQPQGPCQP